MERQDLLPGKLRPFVLLDHRLLIQVLILWNDLLEEKCGNITPCWLSQMKDVQMHLTYKFIGI